MTIYGEGNGNPLQYSCLENPRDGGAWWLAIYGVAQSWTRLKRLSSSSSDYITSSWRLAEGHCFCPLSDAYVRSFLYLLYTLIKLYYTKALSDPDSSLAPDWTHLLWRPRIPASYHSTTIFQYSHLFQNFPQFIVIHTVKGFGIVNKAEIDVFSGTLLLF